MEKLYERRRTVKIEEVKKLHVCLICLKEFKEMEDVTTVGCEGKHVFHSPCIENWAKVVMSCPFCNTDIKVTWEYKYDEEKGK